MAGGRRVLPLPEARRSATPTRVPRTIDPGKLHLGGAGGFEPPSRAACTPHEVDVEVRLRTRHIMARCFQLTPCSHAIQFWPEGHQCRDPYTANSRAVSRRGWLPSLLQRCPSGVFSCAPRADSPGTITCQLARVGPRRYSVRWPAGEGLEPSYPRRSPADLARHGNVAEAGFEPAISGTSDLPAGTSMLPYSASPCYRTGSPS